uniref:Uncharacterized protein n=1 Tax=Arundo donax TaxID=35708 RepID=A0A0A9HAU8_ARUDO
MGIQDETDTSCDHLPLEYLYPVLYTCIFYPVPPLLAIRRTQVSSVPSTVTTDQVHHRTHQAQMTSQRYHCTLQG